MPEEEFSEYSFQLEKTQRRIKRYAQKRFKEFQFDVTVEQWAVLKQLYYHPPLSQTELAELTYKGMPTLTRIVDLLCDKDLAVRTSDTADRRKFIVQLTGAGKEKVAAMLPRVAEIRKAAWAGMNEKDFTDFQRILLKIQRNLEI